MINEHLSTMKGVCATQAFQQNALVKAIALSILLNCFGVKNRLTIEGRREKRTQLQIDIEEKIQYLKDFVENLNQLKLAWNGDLFKFLNNFIFFKHFIQGAIAACELAFLNCEIIFKQADPKDLPRKSHIIEMQIGLLEMQNAIMQFTKEAYEEQYVKCFYFKDEKRNQIISYNTVDRNKWLADAGELHKEVYGIHIDDIQKLNTARKLRLEAIPLEFLANQRKPQEADYEQAISGRELEKYLKQWEREAAAEKALEVKQPKALNKQQRLRKQAAKEVERVKATQKLKENKPGMVVTTIPAVKPVPDQLASKMDELILLLNPRKFNADKVKRVINELHPFTLNSNNNEERVFNALSTIGDSYSMIAGHYLNQSKKHPKELLVNLELALNYYSRAELELRKLTEISFEEHSHYYTWLQHSIGIQRQLLGEYQHKFSVRREQLLASREQRKQELGEEWYKKHLKPGWTKSPLTLQAEALMGALNAIKPRLENDRKVENATQPVKAEQTENVSQAMSVLQEKCRDLENRIRMKLQASESSKNVYSFEHYLNQAGKRELSDQQVTYKFYEPAVVKAPTRAVVEMTASKPDAKGIIDMLPVPKQLNPLENLFLDCRLKPVFNFPYLVLPSAFSQSQLPYNAEVEMPQTPRLPAMIAFDALYAKPNVVYPYQPQYPYQFASYIPPFAGMPEDFPNYFASGYVVPPPQVIMQDIISVMPTLRASDVTFTKVVDFCPSIVQPKTAQAYLSQYPPVAHILMDRVLPTPVCSEPNQGQALV